MNDNDLILESIFNVLSKDDRLKKLKIKHIKIENNNDFFIWKFKYGDKNINKKIYVYITRKQFSLSELKKVENSIDKNNITNIMVVSDFEYESNLVSYAASKNILLVPIIAAEDIDWGSRIRKICVEMKVIRPSIKNFKIDFYKDEAKKLVEKSGKKNFTFEISGTPDQIYFINDNSKKINLSTILSEYENNLKKKLKENYIEEHFRHEFSKTFFIETEIGNIPMKAIEFDYLINEISHPIIIDGNKNIGFSIGFSIIKYIEKLGDIPDFK